MAKCISLLFTFVGVLQHLHYGSLVDDEVSLCSRGRDVHLVGFIEKKNHMPYVQMANYTSSSFTGNLNTIFLLTRIFCSPYLICGLQVSLIRLCIVSDASIFPL